MSIRSRLTIIILSLIAIPLLFVSAITFSNYKNSLTTSRLSQLQNLAQFKVEKIETYFAGLKNTMEMSQGFFNVRKNLPVLARSYKDPRDREAAVARKTLDGQLVRMQKILDLSDVMLADKSGAIVYVSNPEHYMLDLSRSLDEISPESLKQGAKGIYFSDIFINNIVGGRPEMLATAPITALNGAPAGTIILEIDMGPLYRLIQDTTGLGATGEILIGKRSGNDIMYLNPLRHDKDVVLSKHVRIGDKIGLPIQNAVAGKTGIGQSIDYRGINVVAAWRHITFPDWGLVAKIDAREEFAVVTNLQRLLIMVLAVVFVMAGIITFSVTQSISVPIQKLTSGAEIIGSGNLDYKVGMNLNDEIGRLSRTVDKMTGDLKRTLASRDELNREIEFRKKSEDALRESEERFRVIADASPVQISVGREEDGTILFANPEYERAFGFAKGELLGHKTPELYNDPAERNKLIKALKEAGALKNYEIQVKKSDGTPFWVSISINRINYSGGPALLASSIDIAERKRAEEELRLAAEDLSRSNKDLEQFAYVASHDLQEPLRAVGGFMGLLKNQYYDKLDDQAREYIDFSVDGAERMQGLIEGLLTFSRIGTRGGEFAPVNLKDALDKALANLSVLVAESRVSITSDTLPVVKVDPVQMTQLFQNLVANAVKFHGPHNPEIRVGAQRKERAWEIYVRDNGIGIEPQYFERIFMIFQRLHTRTQYKGTGIGLAVCKKIVERHGGKIWVESVPGEGSAFYFTIPDKGEDA